MAQRDKMETECVCVCVSEREREEIESVCCWSDGVREVCVCVFERERERVLFKFSYYLVNDFSHGLLRFWNWDLKKIVFSL